MSRALSPLRTALVTNMHTDEEPDAINALFAGVDIPNFKLLTREVPDWAKTKRGLGVNPTTVGKGKPDGNPDQRFIHRIYEESQSRDIVGDGHFLRNDWGFPFTSAANWANPLVRRMASAFGSSWVMFQDEMHPASWVNGYIGFDMVPRSPFFYGLVELFRRAAEGDLPEERPLQPYRFVAGIDDSQAERWNLSREYSELDRLPDGLARELGVEPPLCVAMWGPGKYVEGWWGEVVTPCDFR